MTNFDEIVRSSSINALLKEGVKTVQKKKGKEYPKHTSKKGKKIIQTSFERDERDKTLTCDGFRRVEEEEEEEEDESSPSFFFLSRWRVHPNDYLVAAREGRDAKTGRRRRRSVSSSSSFLRAGRGRGEGIDFFELSKVL